jgi:hypothetical protein
LCGVAHEAGRDDRGRAARRRRGFAHPRLAVALRATARACAEVCGGPPGAAGCQPFREQAGYSPRRRSQTRAQNHTRFGGSRKQRRAGKPERAEGAQASLQATFLVIRLSKKTKRPPGAIGGSIPSMCRCVRECARTVSAGAPAAWPKGQQA